MQTNYVELGSRFKPILRAMSDDLSTLMVWAVGQSIEEEKRNEAGEISDKDNELLEKLKREIDSLEPDEKGQMRRALRTSFDNECLTLGALRQVLLKEQQGWEDEERPAWLEHKVVTFWMIALLANNKEV